MPLLDPHKIPIEKQKNLNGLFDSDLAARIRPTTLKYDCGLSKRNERNDFQAYMLMLSVQKMNLIPSFSVVLTAV